MSSSPAGYDPLSGAPIATQWRLYLFLVLTTIGGLLCLILLFTHFFYHFPASRLSAGCRSMLGKKTKKSSTLSHRASSINLVSEPTTLNLIGTAVLPAPIWHLLYYDGGAILKGVTPSFSVCAAQAGFAAGWRTLMACATFAVVFKMWTRVTALDAVYAKSRKTFWLDVFLVAYPWIVSTSLAFAGLAYGVLHPQSLTIDYYYCAVRNTALGHANMAISIIHQAAIVGLEIHLIIFIRRHLAITSQDLHLATTSITDDYELGSSSEKTNEKGLQATMSKKSKKGSSRVGGMKLSVVLRPMIFGAFCVLSLVLTFIEVSDPGAAEWLLLMLSSFGFVMFFLWGTLPDILRIWGLARFFGVESDTEFGGSSAGTSAIKSTTSSTAPILRSTLARHHSTMSTTSGDDDFFSFSDALNKDAFEAEKERKFDGSSKIFLTSLPVLGKEPIRDAQALDSFDQLLTPFDYGGATANPFDSLPLLGGQQEGSSTAPLGTSFHVGDGVESSMAERSDGRTLGPHGVKSSSDPASAMVPSSPQSELRHATSGSASSSAAVPTFTTSNVTAYPTVQSSTVAPSPSSSPSSPAKSPIPRAVVSPLEKKRAAPGPHELYLRGIREWQEQLRHFETENADMDLTRQYSHSSSTRRSVKAAQLHRTSSPSLLALSRPQSQSQTHGLPRPSSTSIIAPNSYSIDVSTRRATANGMPGEAGRGDTMNREEIIQRSHLERRYSE